MVQLSEYGVYSEVPEPEMPPLIFFDTSKQQSRLVLSESGCRIELEDKETKKVTTYTVSPGDVKVDPGYKENTGVVDIGNRKNWLYSKRLFLSPEELARQIRLRLRYCT